MTKPTRTSVHRANLRKTIFTMLVLMGSIGSTLATMQSAQAAPAPSAPSNSNAPSGQNEASNGEYQPLNLYVSPKGHVVSAYEPIRSPAFCARLFSSKGGESNKAQYRFWTQCILGGPIN